MECVRGEISSRSAAAIGNAILHDIKDLLKPGVSLSTIMLDKCKMDRAKSKVRYISEEVKSADKSGFVCIGIDGRTDTDTRAYKEVQGSDGNMKLKQCVKSEHHLTFTFETGLSSGEYLTHRTIPCEGATGKLQAKEAMGVLTDFESTETLQAVLLDNTSTNTGHKTGLVVSLESMLGRPIQMVGCALHQNELPWKALFRELDGTTTGPCTFNGTIGKKCCARNLEDTQLVKFKPINTTLVEFPDNVLKELSNDQRLLYEYTTGISRGVVNPVWAYRKVSPPNHAR